MASMSSSLEVGVNVLPAALNAEGTGTVTIAMSVADSVNLGEIDLNSIRLSGGVAPRATSYNGGASLLVDFSEADVILSIQSTLGRAPDDGEWVAVELTGSLLDGRLIHGFDTVQIHVSN